MKSTCPICHSYMLTHLTSPGWLKCSCGFCKKEKTVSDTINWSDPTCKITEHFTVKKALFLPTWNRMALVEDGLSQSIKDKLVILCGVLEKVREILGDVSLNIHSMYRPPEYSKLVGGSLADVHTMGEAVDFDANPNLSCDDVKAKLLPLLESIGLRMEDNGKGAGWVHIDLHPVKYTRFFKA